MKKTVSKQRNNIRIFLVLAIIVVIGGGMLWMQGDLRNPVQSTTMLLHLESQDEQGFAMVSESRTPPQDTTSESSAQTTVSSSETTVNSAEVAAPVESSTVQQTTVEDNAAGVMTLETFTAELAAADVDVEAVSADMSAQGRSLENLLAVVNSGRVTVAELAARLKGEVVTEIQTSPESSESRGTSLLDIQWGELGSVAYNLWFILAVTVIVIVAARPTGWLVNRLKKA